MVQESPRPCAADGRGYSPKMNHQGLRGAAALRGRGGRESGRSAGESWRGGLQVDFLEERLLFFGVKVIYQRGENLVKYAHEHQHTTRSFACATSSGVR